MNGEKQDIDLGNVRHIVVYLDDNNKVEVGVSDAMHPELVAAILDEAKTKVLRTYVQSIMEKPPESDLVLAKTIVDGAMKR